MQLTIKIKILPSKEQETIIANTLNEYIRTINNTVLMLIKKTVPSQLTSKDIIADLPSAVKNQAIRDSKSVYSKYRKTRKQSILKKPMCIWNNQNYKVEGNIISFPVLIDGKSTRLKVKCTYNSYQEDLLKNKLGTLRITQKSGKWIAQIAVNKPEEKANGDNAMGVDLGLKVPAVAVTEDGKTKFFGNGRQNKYIRRKYKSKRRELSKAKKLNAIKKLNDKEQRWMKDQDHKISRAIVNFAIENNVSVIRMEKLTDIRNTAKTSRKNEKNLHTWSFYRLAQFIEYKARLVSQCTETALEQSISYTQL